MSLLCVSCCVLLLCPSSVCFHCLVMLVSVCTVMCCFVSFVDVISIAVVLLRVSFVALFL